jgi:putative PIN family toxin of toxin-antitoxin system
MKAVLDTNIIISALFWGGAPRRIVDLAAERRFQAVTCPELLQELAAVLSDDFGVPRERVAMVVRDVVSYSEVTIIASPATVPLRDPNDYPVVACAIGAGADFIITGDHDLLSLKETHGVRVVSPRTFLGLQEGRMGTTS